MPGLSSFSATPLRTLVPVMALACASLSHAAVPGPLPPATEGAAPALETAVFLPEDLQDNLLLLAQARPSQGYSGNWYVSPQGCAYSRTQAPGYAAQWILIQNPHHLGLPPASGTCPTTL